MLTQLRLQKLLRYADRTGEFYWIAQQRSRSDLVGKRAGCLDILNGYWQIMVDGKRYKRSRLAWLYVYGCFPDKHIDHKNRVKTDDRIINLREATRFQNHANSKVRRSRSGMKGTYWRNGRWEAKIRDGKKRVSLGRFDTAEAAHGAYCKAARALHGEFFTLG